MGRWLWLILLLTIVNGVALAQDPGDAVFFRGPEGGPRIIDEPDIRVGGVPVATVGAASAEYSPALLATTEHLTLFGEQTIDGVLTSNDAVVVWMQTDAGQNGIYLSSSGAWTRRTDADTGAKLAGNKAVLVQAGTRFANTVFRVQNVDPITLGTTAIVIAPEAPQWHLLPVQTIGENGSIDCTPPAAGQVIGTIVPIAGAGEPVSLGNPQIQPGTRLNQMCLVEGADDVNTVDMGDGNGLRLVQGDVPVTFSTKTSMLLRWTGPVWRQLDQTGIVGMGTALTTLQQACNHGEQCGWDLLTDLRPLRIAPAGDDGPKELYYEEGGDFIHARLNGDNTPASPEIIRLRADHSLAIQALLGTPPSWQNIGVMTNVGGFSMDYQGIFAATRTHLDTLTGAHDAWAISFTPAGYTPTTVQQALDKTTVWTLPFTASGLIVDGTACVTQAKIQINGGPTVIPVVCAASASGTLETNVVSPARWDGSPLTVTFMVADTTSSSMVWSANVKAMCRTPGADTINATWGTVVPATVTMVTANIPYAATAVVTPNTGCLGGDLVFIHAAINVPTHNDSSARVISGSVVGR